MTTFRHILPTCYIWDIQLKGPEDRRCVAITDGRGNQRGGLRRAATDPYYTLEDRNVRVGRNVTEVMQAQKDLPLTQRG